MNKEQRAAYIAALDHLESVYRRKNADYGNSAHHTYVEFGEVALVVRISDKLSRLQTLLSGAEAKVKDESILDTIGDAVTYLVILCAEMDTERSDLDTETNKARQDNIASVYFLFDSMRGSYLWQWENMEDDQWRNALVSAWKDSNRACRRYFYMKLAAALLCEYVSLTT